MQILVVDDDQPIRLALSSILSAEGYEVQCASGGQQAIQSLQKGTPDLIITDLAMQPMNGRAFLLHLKASPKWSNIPVIVITGEADRTNVLGAHAILQKPFEIDDLKSAIRSATAFRQDS